MNPINWTRGEPPKDGKIYAATGRFRMRRSFVMIFVAWSVTAKEWLIPGGLTPLVIFESEVEWHWHTPAPQVETADEETQRRLAEHKHKGDAL